MHSLELQFTGAMGTVDEYKVIMLDMDLAAWLSFNSLRFWQKYVLRRWELPFRSVFSRPGIHLPHRLSWFPHRQIKRGSWSPAHHFSKRLDSLHPNTPMLSLCHPFHTTVRRNMVTHAFSQINPNAASVSTDARLNRFCTKINRSPRSASPSYMKLAAAPNIQQLRMHDTHESRPTRSACQPLALALRNPFAVHEPCNKHVNKDCRSRHQQFVPIYPTAASITLLNNSIHYSLCLVAASPCNP